MNVPKSVEEIARQLGFAVKDFPGAVRAGMPTAIPSLKEYVKTIPEGTWLGMRGAAAPSFLAGQYISPTADQSVPLMERFSKDLLAGKRSTSESLMERGVHPALALGAEIAMPSLYQLAGIGTAAQIMKKGVNIPNIAQASQRMGLGMTKPQMAGLAAGFEVQKDPVTGEYKPTYNASKGALASMALGIGVPMAGSFIAGQKAANFGTGQKLLESMSGGPEVEISDAKSLLQTDALEAVNKGKRVTLPLKDVIKHDELFTAYPQLKDVEVKLTGTTEDLVRGAVGQVNEDGTVTVFANPTNLSKLKSNLLHEVQHLIQGIEGWQPGTSPISLSKPGWLDYARNPGELQSRAVELRTDIPQAKLGNTNPYDAARAYAQIVDTGTVNDPRLIQADVPDANSYVNVLKSQRAQLLSSLDNTPIEQQGAIIAKMNDIDNALETASKFGGQQANMPNQLQRYVDEIKSLPDVADNPPYHIVIKDPTTDTIAYEGFYATKLERDTALGELLPKTPSNLKVNLTNDFDVQSGSGKMDLDQIYGHQLNAQTRMAGSQTNVPRPPEEITEALLTIEDPDVPSFEKDSAWNYLLNTKGMTHAEVGGAYSQLLASRGKDWANLQANVPIKLTEPDYIVRLDEYLAKEGATIADQEYLNDLRAGAKGQKAPKTLYGRPNAYQANVPSPIEQMKRLLAYENVSSDAELKRMFMGEGIDEATSNKMLSLRPQYAARLEGGDPDVRDLDNQIDQILRGKIQANVLSTGITDPYVLETINKINAMTDLNDIEKQQLFDDYMAVRPPGGVKFHEVFRGSLLDAHNKGLIDLSSDNPSSNIEHGFRPGGRSQTNVPKPIKDDSTYRTLKYLADRPPQRTPNKDFGYSNWASHRMGNYGEDYSDLLPPKTTGRALTNLDIAKQNDTVTSVKGIFDDYPSATDNAIRQELLDVGVPESKIGRIFNVRKNLDKWDTNTIVDEIDDIIKSGTQANVPAEPTNALNIPKANPAKVFNKALREFEALPNASDAKTPEESRAIYSKAAELKQQIILAGKEALETNQLPQSPSAKRALVKNMLEYGGVPLDRFTASPDGTYTAKYSYYYTHGNSAEKLAKSIQQVIPQAKIVDVYDDFKAWPGTSYFTVKFKLENTTGVQANVPKPVTPITNPALMLPAESSTRTMMINTPENMALGTPGEAVQIPKKPWEYGIPKVQPR